MRTHLQFIGTLTITSGQTLSDVLSSRLGFGSSIDLVIYTPSSLTGTITVGVAGADSETTNFVPLNYNSADVTLPAGRAVVIPSSTFGAIQLSSSLTETGTRTFQVYGQFQV